MLETEVEAKSEMLEAPRWRALVFLRDGRSLLGNFHFSTEATCAEAIKVQEARHKRSSGFWRPTGEIFYITRDYSHAFPVPVR